MTPADISKAQDLSIRCLQSGYTDCKGLLVDELYKFLNDASISDNSLRIAITSLALRP